MNVPDSKRFITLGMRYLGVLTCRLRYPVLIGGVLAIVGLNMGQGASTPTPERVPIEMNPGPFSNVEQGANVVLALSVEYPTLGAAYRANPDAHHYVPYDPNTQYIGYWDYSGCYKYKDNTAGAPLEGEYFYRTGTATVVNGAKSCNTNGRSEEYSGNLLNFVATSAIDILRLGLTGGHREYDDISTTILARAYLPYSEASIWNIHDNYFPARKINKRLLGKEMPLKPYGINIYGDYIYASNCQNIIWFGTQARAGAICNPSPYLPMTDKRSRNLSVPNTDWATKRNNPFLPFFARVKVCDTNEAAIRTDLCKQYPSGKYKPVGNIQKKAENVRIGVFGYLNDNNVNRYGGVLRAPVSYIGPTILSNNIQKQNPNREWDPESGVFIADPRETSAGVKDGAAGGFTYSGAINYLNRFGTLLPTKPGAYKKYDPLGEMYYESLRYFMGKQPKEAAIKNAQSNSNDALSDGFPFYKSWTDPILGACSKKNFILTIGDVNSSERNDLAAEGRFNPRALRTRLIAHEKFSRANNDQRRKWQLAGAAFGANTRSIRTDSINGSSLDGIRVRTFTIDVDEGGNGNIDNTARPRPPRQSSLYLAGKYGWFEDTKVVNQLPDAGEWDRKQANVPDGYVIASQAKKLLDGIQTFFDFLPVERASIFSLALSATRFSNVTKDAHIFLPSLNPADWTGSVRKKRITYDSSTNQLAVGDTVWDAADILTQGKLADGTDAVAWNNRKIFTFSRDIGKTGGQAFTVANKGNLDAAVINSLQVDMNSPDMARDAWLDERINFIRGDRSHEKRFDGTGFFRKRSSLMGDVVTSGPVYKSEFDTGVLDSDYVTFVKTNKNRNPAVYVGANDGMLHAFDGETGKELFAYIPRAVAENLNKLTKAQYSHAQFVDAMPAVQEAKIYDAGTNKSAWKTVLVSGMGGGAQGVFALDVTDPVNFSENQVLFEFTDQDDPDIGNITGAPTIIKINVKQSNGASVGRWFVAIGSGYNNYMADDHPSNEATQALFLLSLDKKTKDSWELNKNYFKIKVQPPTTPTTTLNQPAGMANPAVAKDIYGNAKIFYAGDLDGNLWKFDLSDGLNAANAENAVKRNANGTALVPLAVLTDASGKKQPVTTVPTVSRGLRKGYMVVVGTGKFMESSDATTSTVTQAVYGVWDDLVTYEIERDDLYQRNFVANNNYKLSGSPAFNFGNTSGKYMGWVVTLPQAKERIVVEGTQGPGYTAFTSVIPGDECFAGGGGASMCFYNLYGGSCADYKNSQLGFLGRSIIVTLDDSSGDYSYSARTATGKRTITIKQKTVSIGSQGAHEGSLSTIDSVPAGRVGWREIRQFLN